MIESYNIQSKVTIVNAIRTICVIILIMIGIGFILLNIGKINYDKSNTKAVSYFIVFTIMIVIWGYKNIYKYVIIKPLSNMFDCQIEYKKSGDLRIEDIREFGIFGSFDPSGGFVKTILHKDVDYNVETEDKFFGTLKNHLFRFEEFKIVRCIGSGKYEKKETVMRSYMIELEMLIHEGCEILAYTDDAACYIAENSVSLQRVITSDWGQRKWHFMSDKPETCRNIIIEYELITVLERMISIVHDSLGEKQFIYHVKNGMIYLFVPSQKNRFDFSHYRWISTEDVKICYQELKAMVDMINILINIKN